MKLTKIFALALAVATLASCDDNNVEDYPNFLGGVNKAADVSVSLPTTFEADENQVPFMLPVNVTGETNGKVVVTVKAIELTQVPEGLEPAKVVDHYNITSYTINIPEGETEGYIEVMPVWVTGEINDDRVFDVEITAVEGAAIGNKTCRVTIRNIDNPYTSMCGKWNMTCKRNGVDASYVIDIKTPSSDSEDYGTFLMAFGIANDSEYLIPFVDFTFDETTMTGTMKIGYGKMMTDGLAFNYGDPVGVAFPVCAYKGASGLTLSHEAICTFDGNYNEIVVPADANIVGALFSNSTGQYTGYTIGTYTDIKLTR